MIRTIRKTKIYSIDWEDGLYFLSLHFSDDGLITDYYRPANLQNIGRNKSIAQEKREEEFLCIWAKYVIGLSICSEEKDIVEKNIGALTFSVMHAVSLKRGIRFWDLLLYIDCFAIMLKEQGIPEQQLREMYMPVTEAILSNFDTDIIGLTDIDTIGKISGND